MITSIVTVTAVSLYSYNVDPLTRATKLFQHFNGECADLDDLIRWVDDRNWATEMPYPTAVAYLKHAVDKYGEEATRRCAINSANL